MSRTRSLYTTDQENDAIQAVADQHKLAWNTVVRLAIRGLIGLPVPAWADELWRTDDEREREP